MKERGLGHIEMILAFVIFIGFLFFGLYFFNPLDTGRVLDSSLFYAADAVYDEASSPLLTYSIVIKNSTAPAQVQFALNRDLVTGPGVRVETNEATKLFSRYAGNILSVDRQDEDFFVVKFGEFPYNEDLVASPMLLREDEDYSISSSDNQRILSEQLLDELKTRYYQDYDEVKKDFNLPGRIDFYFSVVFPNGDEIKGMQPIPLGADVITQRERKEILRLDGSITFADVIFGVW